VRLSTISLCAGIVLTNWLQSQQLMTTVNNNLMDAANHNAKIPYSVPIQENGSEILASEPLLAGDDTTDGVDDTLDVVSAATPSNSRIVALIPLSDHGAYNACNDNILHLSCLTTIILDDEAAVDRLPVVVPVANQLYTQFCDTVFSKEQEIQFQQTGALLEQVERAEANLCLQAGRTVGALVEATTTMDTILNHLPADYADHVAQMLLTDDNNNSNNYRIVHRSSILMTQTYWPFSTEHNKWRRSDENRGNFVWQFGATRMINPYTTQIFTWAEYNWMHWKDVNFSAVVLADANALDLDDEERSKEGIQRLKEMVKNSNLPTILLGIGIQKMFENSTSSVNSIDSFHDKLFDHQAEYLKEIEKHQTIPAMSVRGELTKKACENSGISHCVALGCPSLTISTEANLGAKLQANWQNLLERVERKERIKLGLVMPAHVPTGEHEAVVNQLLKIAHSQHHDTSIVIQDRFDDSLLKAVDEGSVERVTFDNIEEWLNFTAGLDLVLSPRIHGSMAGLASATPVAVIAMDYRIKELVDAMLMPKLSLQEFRQATNDAKDDGDILSHVLKSVDVDYAAFEDNRKKRLASYVEILKHAGLEMNPSLLDIVKKARVR